MGPSRERCSLVGLSVDQLREYWGKADDEPGEEITVEGLGDVTKGELALEIASRADVRSAVQPVRPQQRSPRRRYTFHPIDGSYAMRDISRVGWQRAMARR